MICVDDQNKLFVAAFERNKNFFYKTNEKKKSILKLDYYIRQIFYINNRTRCEFKLFWKKNRFRTVKSNNYHQIISE